MSDIAVLVKNIVGWVRACAEAVAVRTLAQHRLHKLSRTGAALATAGLGVAWIALAAGVAALVPAVSLLLWVLIVVSGTGLVSRVNRWYAEMADALSPPVAGAGDAPPADVPPPAPRLEGLFFGAALMIMGFSGLLNALWHAGARSSFQDITQPTAACFLSMAIDHFVRAADVLDTSDAYNYRLASGQHGGLLAGTLILLYRLGAVALLIDGIVRFWTYRARRRWFLAMLGHSEEMDSVVEILARRSGPTLLPLLEEALAGGSKAVRKGAVSFLRSIASARATDVLVAVADAPWLTFSARGNILARIFDEKRPEAEPIALRWAQSPHEQERKWVAKNLTRQAASAARVTFERLRRDDVVCIRAEAYHEAVNAFPDDRKAIFESALRDSEAEVRGRMGLGVYLPNTISWPRDRDLILAVLRAQAADPDPEPRAAASEAIVHLPEAAAELQVVFVKLMRDSDPTVRLALYEAIRERPEWVDGEGFDALLWNFDRESSRDRDSVFEAIESAAPRAVPEKLRAFVESRFDALSPKLAERALKLCAKLKIDLPAALLERRLDSAPVIEGVAWYLIAMRPPGETGDAMRLLLARASPALKGKVIGWMWANPRWHQVGVSGLADGLDAESLRGALPFLFRSGAPTVPQDLAVKIASGPDRSLRLALATAVRTGQCAGLPDIVAALMRDPYAEVALEAALAAATLGMDEGMLRVREFLAGGSKDIERVLKLVGQYPELKIGAADLDPLLRHADPGIRQEAIRACGRLMGQECWPRLEVALADSNTDGVSVVLEVLEETGLSRREDVRARLRGMLNHSSEWVQMTVKDLLKDVA